MKMVGILILKCLAKAIACKRQWSQLWLRHALMLQKNFPWKPGPQSLKFQRWKYQKNSEGISYKNYLNFLTESAFFGRYLRRVCSS